jgi:hypothetical protein
MVRPFFTLALTLVFATASFAQDAAAPADGAEAAPTAAPAADAAPAATPAPAADAAPAAPAPAPAAESAPPPDRGGDEPSIEERRVVAYVASGASLVALGVGVTMGVLASQQFACLEDVIACNADLEDPIEGTELLDARAEVEHKALVADMMYLVAGAAAVVAATGFVRGFVMTGEESDATASLGVQEPLVAVGGER